MMPPVTRIPRGSGTELLRRTQRRQAATRRKWLSLSIEEKMAVMEGVEWALKTGRANDTPLPLEADGVVPE